jgi:hypothetical protein
MDGFLCAFSAFIWLKNYIVSKPVLKIGKFFCSLMSRVMIALHCAPSRSHAAIHVFWLFMEEIARLARKLCGSSAIARE